MSLKDLREWVGVYGEAGSGKKERMFGEVEGKRAYIDVRFLIWWSIVFLISLRRVACSPLVGQLAWKETAQVPYLLLFLGSLHQILYFHHPLETVLPRIITARS